MRKHARRARSPWILAALVALALALAGCAEQGDEAVEEETAEFVVIDEALYECTGVPIVEETGEECREYTLTLEDVDESEVPAFVSEDGGDTVVIGDALYQCQDLVEPTELEDLEDDEPCEEYELAAVA